MTRQAINPAKPKKVSPAVFERAIDLTEPMSRAPADLAPPSNRTESISRTAALLSTIRTLGQLLDDLERVRIANGNRIAALERDYGESPPHLDVVQKQIKVAEHLAELELVRVWRKHPLAPWAKQFRGVGEKSIARLVAIIGDPGERENVAKVWAYCGHGDAGRRPRKGMTQAELFKLGNPAAKKQTWLIATSLLKTGNRGWYDARRAITADRVHSRPCVRCGPSGHPAAVGSPWSAAHQHADALRYVGKQFLKELWIASRHTRVDTHTLCAGGEL